MYIFYRFTRVIRSSHIGGTVKNKRELPLFIERAGNLLTYFRLTPNMVIKDRFSEIPTKTGKLIYTGAMTNTQLPRMFSSQTTGNDLIFLFSCRMNMESSDQSIQVARWEECFSLPQYIRYTAMRTGTQH